jgi:hypothetical protein
MYKKVRGEITQELKTCPISLTTDIWSRVNMTPYMSRTVHYISSDWSHMPHCLETTYMPENHTADNLSEALRSVLAEWALDEKKVSCSTTDNRANIVAAVRQLGWPWLNCFGHKLHLAVTEGVAKHTTRAFDNVENCKNKETLE